MPPPAINVNYAVAKTLIGIRECSLFTEGVSEIMGGLTSFGCFKGFAHRRGRKSSAVFTNGSIPVNAIHLCLFLQLCKLCCWKNVNRNKGVFIIYGGSQ